MPYKQQKNQLTRGETCRVGEEFLSRGVAKSVAPLTKRDDTASGGFETRSFPLSVPGLMENLLDSQKTIVRKYLSSKEPQLQPNPIFFPITQKAEDSNKTKKKGQIVY
jgi:hypothetical protein